MKRAIRLAFRLLVLGSLLWLARGAFKRWVEGPGITPASAKAPWPPVNTDVAPLAAPRPAEPRPADQQPGSEPAEAAHDDGKTSDDRAGDNRARNNGAGGDEVTWVKANGSAEAPATHPVKAKVASRVYRIPGMAMYDQSKADRFYRTPEAAEADGFTKAKR